MKQIISTVFLAIVNAGILPGSDAAEQKKLRVLNLTVFVSASVTFCFVLLNVALGFPELVFVDTLMVVALASCVLLNLLHYHRLSRVLLFYVFPVILLYYPYYVGNIGTEYYYFVFLILGYYVFERFTQMAAVSVLVLSVFTLSKYFIATGDFPPQYRILETVHYYPSMILSVMLIIGATALFKYDTIQYQRAIAGSNVSLAHKVEELAEKNRFADQLLRELNHRVKNNLQLISSLFAMQSYETANASTREALQEARARVDTVAIMYQRLYKDSCTLDTDLADYLGELARFCQLSAPDGVSIYVEAQPISLRLEHTVHIGLVVNELLTNSVKHGQADPGEALDISLRVQQRGGDIHIFAADTGRGFAPEAMDRGSDSFGMVLIRAIVQQYDGTMEIFNDRGACVHISMHLT